MSLSKYTSTPETTNTARLARLILGPSTDVLREILKKEILPSDLSMKVKEWTDDFKKNKKGNPLNPSQNDIIFPPLTNQYRGDYSDLDISILYVILRNVSKIPPHSKGWGKLPDPADRSVAANIERIRLLRNKHQGHSAVISLSDSEYRQEWRNIRDIVVELERHLGTSIVYQESVTEIKTCSMDPELEHKYINRLGVVDDLHSSVSRFSEKLSDMEKRLSFDSKLEKEIDLPRITLRGATEIICGGTVCFDADIEQSKSTQNWYITWFRVRGSDLEHINPNKEEYKKYKDSTVRQLVIQRVSKEEQGDYKAYLTGHSNGQFIEIPSNTLTLKILGERPVLQKLEITSGSCGISLHYKFEVTQGSPKVDCITWTKNGEVLGIDNTKYIGGDITDNSLTITSPSVQDSGKFTCSVTNAVGPVSESMTLGVPTAKISAESVCYGNNAHIDSDISSCPQAERAVWEMSKDAVNFEPIDTRERKYCNTSLDPSNPILQLKKATFDEKLYYRLRIWNSIGESLSNTVHLKVTGGPPNISSGHETLVNSRSVKLTCDVFLYDQSPPLTELEWQKDGHVIDIRGSGEKYAGGTIDEPTLIIRNVNQSDAGLYQCKASNAVGSTFGEAVFLGVPVFQVLGPENTESGICVFQMNSSSCPAVFSVQWSKKNKDNDEYTPVDVNDKEYLGSSNSLPNPKLVIKQAPAEKHSFKVEAQNFIGTSMKKIPDNCFCPTDNTMDNKENRLAAIFKKKGSSIRFNKLRIHLIKNISELELNSLKESLNVITSMELSTENITTVEGFFTLILKEGILKERNVIMMQCLLESIERSDLEHKCVEYAIEDKQAACYFKEPKLPENGYAYVQLHVVDDIEHFTDIDSLVATVAATVGCDKSRIKVVGLHPESSFVIVLSMPECFAQTLGQKGPQDLAGLLKYNVDWLKIDNRIIYITRGNEEKVKVPGRSTGDSEDEENIEGQSINKERNQKTKGDLSSVMKNVIIRNVYAVGMHHYGLPEMPVDVVHYCKWEPQNPYDNCAICIFADKEMTRRVGYFRREDSSILYRLFKEGLIVDFCYLKAKQVAKFSKRKGPMQNVSFGFKCEEKNVRAIQNIAQHYENVIY